MGDKMKSNDLVMEDLSKVYVIKRRLYFIIKRLFDICCSLVGMLILIPLTIIVKICYICTGDFGSVFYRQERLGKNGVVFSLYKYRTMVKNADEKLKELLNNNESLKEEYLENHKLKNDPRITRCGKLLRKLSLDEFPQFINVFLGQMSLICNRPYLPREKEHMGKYYDEIVKTKPGITGLWQVSGRSDVSFKKRLELEKRYSNENSLRLDIKILWHTFRAVLKGDGAL